MADAGTLAGLRARYGGAVVVVDEMSLAGTAQARALLRIAERLEVARLVLVGDSRQLRGVQAGPALPAECSRRGWQWRRWTSSAGNATRTSRPRSRT